jgi:acetyl-CoA acetyltransferase
MSKAYIIGYGQTKCGFFPERDMRSLLSDAYIKAIQYSGIDPKEIGQIWLSHFPKLGDQMTSGQVAIEAVGLGSRVGCITIEQACASTGQAIHDAALGIESGRYECVLLLGFAKMTDSMRPGEKPGIYPFQNGPFEESGFNPFYSHAGVILTEPGQGGEYLKYANVTAEDVASFNLVEYWYATKHPNSLCYQQPIPTKEELLAVGGGPREGVGCDGASAVILASKDFARKVTDVLIYIAAVAHKLESSYYAKALDYGYGGDAPRGVAGKVNYSHSAENAWKECFEQAKVGPKDLDLVQAMHHPDILPGRAPKWFTEGEAYPGGKLPVTTLGAAKFGEPRGSHGINFLIENYMQLKEECGEWQVPLRNHVAGGGVSPGRPALHILRRED